MNREKQDFNLKKYASLAAMALASSGMVKAEVHVTDVNPDVNLNIVPANIIGDEISYDLDINNDGTVDLRISAIVDFYQYKPHRPKQEVYKIIAKPQNGTEILKGTFVAKKVEEGQSIPGVEGTWVSSSEKLAEQDHEEKVSGEWAGANDNYLAVKLSVNGNTHYGWVRLSVDDEAFGCTIKEYAYNDVALEAIVTGGTTSVTNNLDNSKEMQLYLNNRTLVVKDNGVTNGSKVIQLYDLEGRLLKTENLENLREQHITIPGIHDKYIIAVIKTDDNIVLSQKFVVK